MELRANKLLRIFLSILILISTILYVLAKFFIDTPNIVKNTTIDYVPGILTLITAIILFTLAKKSFSKSKESEDEVAGYIMGYFIFTGISASINTILSFFLITDGDISVLFSLMIGYCLSFGFIFLFLFDLEVFLGGVWRDSNIRKAKIFIYINVLTCFILASDYLFSTSDIIMVLSISMVFCIMISVYGILISESIKLQRYFTINNDLGEKKRFTYILLSGVCLLISFLLIVVNSESTNELLNVINLVIMVFGYFFLYLGFFNKSK